MKATVLAEGDERVFALVFDTGDKVVAELVAFATQHSLRASRLSAIGGFSDVTVGFFDWESKDYRRIPIDGQVELIALLGDITLADDRPKVHAHVVVGLPDGTTRGGHLLEATVRPTLEVVLEESPAHLRRVHDPTTGLPLIQVSDQRHP
jgi:predicted DNA-binding protein with PD1-like motif